MDVKFKFEKKSVISMSLGVKIRPFPFNLHVGLPTVQRYRAACEYCHNNNNNNNNYYYYYYYYYYYFYYYYYYYYY